MEQISIRQLNDKDLVDAVFLVKEKTLSIGKNGRPFMSLILSNTTGNLDSRAWDRVDEMSREFDLGDVVKAKGQIQIFQGRKQLIIHRIERVAGISADEFIPKSQKNPEDVFMQVLQIAKSLKNDHLRQLVVDTLEDQEIKSLMVASPAAKTIHHAWKGGLIEHILSICQTMDFMAAHYSYLNRDLLMFGAIFHDIGKIWELSTEGGINYTDRGRLLGHMQLACELIDRKAARILGFSEELRDICKHIVLGHHGKLEYGSPKRPKFMEALVVAMVDDFDSKMNTVQTFIEEERSSGSKWSRYNDLFDRYFLLDDLKEKF